MRVIKFPLLTLTISFAAGIVAQFFMQFSFNVLFAIISIFFLLFGYFFWRSIKNLLQNIFFGTISYLLVFILGMLTFFVHSDKNKSNHYSKSNIENTTSIRAIVETSLKPNSKYNKYFIQLSLLMILLFQENCCFMSQKQTNKNYILAMKFV